MPDAAATPDAPRRPFWKRRLTDPIYASFTQGVTPDKVAATLAVGTAVSMFPFLGCTTVMNLLVGIRLRMNQPLLQAINYLLTPVHLVMIIVYIRIGEWIWRANDGPITIRDLVDTFRNESFMVFLSRFGWAGVHAFTAWLISVPLIIAVLYYALRPVMRRIAALKKPAED